MNAIELKAYEILKDRLGEEKALTILEFADYKADQKMNEKKDTLLTKDDKMDLINCMKNDKVDLISRMKEDKVDLIKWMVGFWIAQIAAIIGLYFKGH